MDAIQLIAEGSMQAAALHLPSFPRIAAYNRANPSLGAELITGALRQTLKVELPKIMNEWKNAIAAMLPESALKHLVNVQCNHVAVEALKMVNEEV